MSNESSAPTTSVDSDLCWKCTGCKLVNESSSKSCDACFVGRKKDSVTLSLTATKWKEKKKIWSSDESEKKKNNAKAETEKGTKEGEEEEEEEEEKKEEEEEKNEYLKPIEYEIQLDQRPFGFSLCKELDEKYICKVIPTSLCGQKGMICGSECIAIDSFLLDGDNWSYVNKKYPDVPFFYMPDFSKVEFLQSPRDLAQKPILLRLRFHAMKTLSLGQNSENEKCESWPVIQKDLYQTLIEAKPKHYRALQTLQVFKGLPFQGPEFSSISAIQQGEVFQGFLQAGAFLQIRSTSHSPFAWVKFAEPNAAPLVEEVS